MKKRKSKQSRAREVEAPEPVREFEIAIPFDAVNEQVILGSMLVDEEACDRLLPVVPVDSLQVEEHKIMREAIGEARRLKLGLDPATLVRLRPALDPRILEDLMAARPDGTPNLKFHLDTLRRDHVRAQATRGPLQSLVDLVGDPTSDFERIRAVARQVGEAFSADGGGLLIKDRRDVLRRVRETLRKRQAGDAWYPYGIHGLDYNEEDKRRHRPGMAPGMITVLSASSGGGKSTVAGHMMRGQAHQKRRVLAGAWEIEASMTAELLATMELGWSRSRVLDGRSCRPDAGELDPMLDEEIDELYDAAEKLTEYITFVDNPYKRRLRGQQQMHNEDHIDTLVENIKASGAEVVFLDLYDRMLSDRQPDEEQEAIFHLVEAVMELQVHLVLVHQQLLKGPNVRKDNRPSIAGLKGSSAITDGASLVLAPFVPGLYKNVPNDTMELIALKGRWCPPFAVEFDYVPDTGQISGGRTISRDELAEDSGAAAFEIAPKSAPRSQKGYGGPSVQKKRR